MSNTSAKTIFNLEPLPDTENLEVTNKEGDNKPKYRYVMSGHTLGTGTAYSPASGSFSKISIGKNKAITPVNWYRCREQFHHYCTKGAEHPKSILMSHPKSKGHRIAKFLREVEEKLNLKKFSVVSGFENNKGVSLIRINPWWGQNPARSQLLTILLRCGLFYDGENFEPALYHETYAKQTKAAIKKFFKGYTHCSKSPKVFKGWVREFAPTAMNPMPTSKLAKEMVKGTKPSITTKIKSKLNSMKGSSSKPKPANKGQVQYKKMVTGKL